MFNIKTIKITLIITLASINLFAAGEEELLAAARDGSLEHVKVVCKNHPMVNINAHEPNSFITSLHYAIDRDNRELTIFLLDRQASINAQDNMGYTPLHIAVSRRYLTLVKLLVDAGADTGILTHNRETPLDLALLDEYAPISKYLISKKAPKGCYDDRKIIMDDEYGITEGGCLLL